MANDGIAVKTMLPDVLVLRLSIDEINHIVGRMAKDPYDQVGMLIPKIQQQVQAQALPIVTSLERPTSGRLAAVPSAGDAQT